MCSRDNGKVAFEQFGFAALNLAMLDSPVIQESVQFHRFVGSRAIFVLKMEIQTGSSEK